MPPTTPTTPTTMLAAAADDDDFVRAMQLADEEALTQRRKAFSEQIRRVKLLRRKRAESYPFHSPEETLQAAITALAAATGHDAPAKFDLSSDPELIFRHVIDAVSHTQAEAREEGRQLAQDALPARVDSRLVPAAVAALQNLNKILA